MRWIPGLGLLLCLGGNGCGAAFSHEDADRSAANLESSSAGGSDGCGNTNARVAVFQNGRVLDGTVYAGTSDTTIRQAAPNTNNALDPNCTIKGATKSAVRKECLVRWELSHLPTTTTVGTSCIRLKVSDGSKRLFQAFEMLRPWLDTQATWNNATSAAAWETPGAWAAADSEATVVATIPEHSVPGTLYELMLPTALVQKWISNPAANNGLVFGGNGGDSVAFVASEQADGPALVVALP